MINIDDILEDIPYTIPWWENLLRSLMRWPERLWRRVNVIIDEFQWQCQGSLLFYVRTMLPAFGQFVLGLLEFDWDDVVRGALRPYGFSGRRSLVAGPHVPKWKLEIPELGEEIGKRLPGVRLIKANRYWKWTRAFWYIDGLIQRALYYVLIVDLVSEFLYNWSIGILRVPEECGAAYIARGGVYGDSGRPGPRPLVMGGPFSEIVAEPGPDAGFRVAGDRIYVERPCAVLGSYRMRTIFPLECRLGWRMYLLNLQTGWRIDPTPLGHSGPGYAQSVMGVFQAWEPGYYQLVGELEYSSCSTIAQELEICAIKDLRYRI